MPQKGGGSPLRQRPEAIHAARFSCERRVLDMLVINSRLSVPLSELDFSFSRSSGPGGQNVNKVNTKATLHWNVNKNNSLPEPVKARFTEKYRQRINSEGELVLSSQRFRDQGRNVADCLSKLRTMIEAIALPPKPRKKTRLSAGAKRRRVAEKRRTADKKLARKSPRLED